MSGLKIKGTLVKKKQKQSKGYRGFAGINF